MALDLGGRWRFRLRDARAVARLQVQDVAGNGVLVIANPRRASLSVTADF